MSKKDKSKIRAPEEFKLNKQRLLYEEIMDYQKIGIPDFSQNYLELFSSDVIHDLITLSKSSSDNQAKAEAIIDELSDLGFEALGLGTNVLTLINPIYPGVVFKIGLDFYGIADNINDEWLSESIPHYAKFICRDLTGIVSVQQRYTVIKSLERMMTLKEEILPVLNKLAKKYLVIDLGLNNFLNYGLDRNGDFIIVDGSDLYPISNAKTTYVCPRGVSYKGDSHKMKRCGGHLEYDEFFHTLVCSKCGMQYNPGELRPNQEGAIMRTELVMDGLSAKERFSLEEDAIRKIMDRKNSAKKVIGPKLSLADEMRMYEFPNEVDDDDDEEVEMKEEEEIESEVDEDTEEEDFDEMVARSIAEDNCPDPDEEEDEDEEPDDVMPVNEVINDPVEIKTPMSDIDMDDDEPENDFVTESRRAPTMKVDNGIPMIVDTDVNAPTKFNEPGVRYEIRNGSLYIISSGDFDTNYDENSLPIVLSLDNGQEYTLIANSQQVKEFLDACIRDAKEDQRL